MWGGCGEAVRERREEEEEGGGREGEEGGGREEPRSLGWSSPWLFHLPIQGPDGVTKGLGSKTTWMTSRGAVSESGGTEMKGGAGQARALRNSGWTLGRAGLLCRHPRARSQHSPHPPPQRTRRARRWCSPREEGPPSLRPQTPKAQQRAFFPVFGGRQSRLLAEVCPPRFCLQLCPLAQPDYLTMVEVPGPPQRLHPPPPPTAAPGPGGRVLRVRLGSQAGCGFQNSICSV